MIRFATLCAYLCTLACAPAGSKGLQPPYYGANPVMTGLFTFQNCSVEIRENGTGHIKSPDFEGEYAVARVDLDPKFKRSGYVTLENLTATTSARVQLGTNGGMYVNDVSGDFKCMKLGWCSTDAWFCKEAP